MKPGAIPPTSAECDEIIEHMSYNLGTAVKYICRAEFQCHTSIDDMKKAISYIQHEIERLDTDKKLHTTIDIETDYFQ